MKTMKLDLKAKRLLVWIGCHGLALFLLYIAMVATAAAGQSSTAGFFGMLLVGYLLTLRVNPLPKKVEDRAIKEAECPTCAEAIDLDDMWNCGCGFVKWEARHAFSPCPHCKKVFSWLSCPRCDASIPI